MISLYNIVYVIPVCIEKIDVSHKSYVKMLYNGIILILY